MNLKWIVKNSVTTRWEYQVDGLNCYIEKCGSFNAHILLANIGYDVPQGQGNDPFCYRFDIFNTGFPTIEAAQKWVEDNLQFMLIHVAPLKALIKKK